MTLLDLQFRARGLASETAWLGGVRVGEVIPLPLGLKNRATWQVALPGLDRKAGGSTTFEAARRKIAHEVEQWLRSAGAADGVRVILSDELRRREK